MADWKILNMENIMKHDPQEDDPTLKDIIDKAGMEAEKELMDSPRMLGFCHILWATQKRILKDIYNIDWKTPSEMNPEVLFD